MDLRTSFVLDGFELSLLANFFIFQFDVNLVLARIKHVRKYFSGNIERHRTDRDEKHNNVVRRTREVRMSRYPNHEVPCASLSPKNLSTILKLERKNV